MYKILFSHFDFILALIYHDISDMPMQFHMQTCIILEII